MNIKVNKLLNQARIFCSGTNKLLIKKFAYEFSGNIYNGQLLFNFDYEKSTPIIVVDDEKFNLLDNMHEYSLKEYSKNSKKIIEQHFKKLKNSIGSNQICFIRLWPYLNINFLFSGGYEMTMITRLTINTTY